MRDQVVVAAADLPPLAANRPYTTRNGSVAADLVAFATHDHPLFGEDNRQLYFDLEKALRSTLYASSLKPFQREKDGRSAYHAIVQQYAGMDKWESELKRCNSLLTTRVWKGNSNFKLESFVNQHRNAYINMRRCSEHVPFQLPLELTRVTYLLDAIESHDPELQAAIANVRMDNGADGKMNDFEATAAYLIPRDPVSRKRKQEPKRPHAEVSVSEASKTSAPSISK